MKPWEYGKLRISDNKKYLMNGEHPFFWLGDTAWLLFAELNETEAYTYLKNRKEKGYNVIQATLIHKWPQLNADGAPALVGADYTKPDMESGFWQRVFKIVDMAEELGLYIGLLPTWGGNVKAGRLNETNADPYIDFLLSHFADRPNIIWIVGGDVKGEAAFPVFVRIGKRLKEGGHGALVGFHPFGRTTSSRWFQNESWCDFNMFQSGHRRYDQVTMSAWDDNQDSADHYGEDNWKYVQHDLALTPLKPTVDGEPSYEQIPQGLHDLSQPCWQSWDVRRYAYWSTFAGAFGHTYGANGIMQFNHDTNKAGAYGARQHWMVEMNYIGAACMTHLKALMESVDFINGNAAEVKLLASPQGEKYERISVFAGEDYVLCYDYLGKVFDLDLSSYEGNFEIRWMDPVTGVYGYVGNCANDAKIHFEPPKRFEGHNDWVLVLTKEK